MDLSLTKKNSKFENFLKKKLDDKTFHRVRGYEACIACWEKENKAFKFVILTDEHILLTENPPKTITPVVSLQNVLAIDLVDDYPNFLSGSERLNTLHLVVHHTVASLKAGKDKVSTQSLAHLESAASAHVLDSQSSRPNSAASAQSSSHADGHVDAGEEMLRSVSLPTLLSQASAGSPRDQLNNWDGATDWEPYALKEASTQSSKSPVALTAGSSLSRHHDSGSNSGSKVADGLPFRSLTTVTESKDLPPSFSADRHGCTTASLHLYMLSAQSSMFSLMKYAADNCAIRSTLMMDQEYSQRFQQHQWRGTNEEKVEVQFSSLTQELLTPRNSLESAFNLIRELKTAAEKDFFLKKLFWKNENLFSFFVHQLQRYLPRSPHTLRADTTSRMRRADELELVILIIQTLELMFRETEIFPARLHVLAAHSGRLAAHLAATLTCQPELPPRCQLPSTKAARLLVQTKADELQWSAEEELQELCEDYVRCATGVVFELLLIAQQSYWGSSDGSFLNVGWMVRKLEQHGAASEFFVERLIHQALQLMNPSKVVMLSPSQAVLVFQQFAVLQALIVHSKHFSAFVKGRYQEEFKYYIRAHALAEKLSPLYPISRRALHLMEDVISRIVL